MHCHLDFIVDLGKTIFVLFGGWKVNHNWKKKNFNEKFEAVKVDYIFSKSGILISSVCFNKVS